MKTELIDAFSNIRIISGIIRIDLMNVTGQNQDGSYIFSKAGEIGMSRVTFNQALNMMKRVDQELKNRSAKNDEAS